MSDTFRDRKWRVSYKTSSVDEQGRPINVLREFYIPALSRAVTYDRVAGYFRSSALAVASEGYTALLNRPEGHIRLIVGADLDVKDVQAILNGDEKRMTKELLNELTEPESWDEAVQDGVSLLSAMIASGRMEIRVALRKHSATGEAIAFEDTSDGYVHEKWMVMKDAAGNTIGASGSFNESLTAMKKNAENIDVFCSWNEGTDAERIREYEVSFDMVWKNKNPALAVLPLPVAVRERLIIIGNTYGKIQEIDERIRKLQKKPKVLDLLRFAVLRDAPYMPGGEMLGRSFEQLKTSDPYLWKQIQDSCVDSKNTKVLAGLAVYDQTVKHADRKYLNRPLFAASPLSRVMMRHTRSLLEVYKKNGELKSNLAHRTVLPLSAVQFTPMEKRLYDELEEYCAELNHEVQFKRAIHHVSEG